MMVYQTFGDTPGDSDSPAKLERLRISPERWRNAHVLDIGCNAGFFCEAAAAAGARSVTGIDKEFDLIIEARQKASQGVCYQHLDWTRDTLPSGPWDVVLMLSAIHYERDQPGLLRRINDTLATNGVLVLECGVSRMPGEVWQRCTRPGNSTVRYPSLDLLQRMMAAAGLTCRPIGPSVNQTGDQIPRHVFHCHRLQPTLMIVSGAGRAGKTSLCRSLGCVIFSVDNFTRATAQTELAPWTRTAIDCGLDRLQPFYDSITADDSAAELDGFIDSLFDCLPTVDAATVAVDCLDILSPSIHSAALARGFRVWQTTAGDSLYTIKPGT